MGDYTEADAAHVRGWIDGYLEGAAEYCDQETEFLETRWQELAGSRVIYSSIPAWPSEEARRRRDPPVVLCDWDANSVTSRTSREGAA